MKLKLKNTPEQVELAKAIGSRDQNVAREASEAFATFLGPVIQKVLLSAGTEADAADIKSASLRAFENAIYLSYEG